MARTKAQIPKRISDFEALVNRRAKKIVEIGNASWNPIKESTETPAIRSFLTKRGAGVDYLNRNLAKLLSKDGRVVKFAGLFLHGTPMVEGWCLDKAGRKRRKGVCELADLMTVFLYLDRDKVIKRMRCVLFQAKMTASKGAHVVDARTLPSDKDKGKTLAYGDHLVHFLNGKTGLNQGRRKDHWNQITTELMESMADKAYTDGKIKGPGIRDVLNHFNSFEEHDVWCIDEGQSEDGFGVQFMIVWDDELPGNDPQTSTLPTIPVKNVRVPVIQEETEELEITEEELELHVLDNQM